MKPSDDVVNLFQQFGAKPGPYQELARQQEHQLSRDRWPLVTAVQGAVVGDIPSVVRRGGGATADAPLAAPTLSPAPQTAPHAALARPALAAWAPQPAPAPLAPAAMPVEPAAHSAAFAPPAAVLANARTAPVAPIAPPAPAAPVLAAPPVAAPALASRSPLASLAGLRSGGLAPAPEPEPQALPADLSSVFARLAAPASAAPAVQPAAPVWQPRRGPSS